MSYYDTAKERQKLLEWKSKTGNKSKKWKRSSKNRKKGKPPPVTVLTRADCRRLNGLYGSRCLVKFKDLGSGSRSTIVEESEEIDGGLSNCFFVAIGSLLFPS